MLMVLVLVVHWGTAEWSRFDPPGGAALAYTWADSMSLRHVRLTIALLKTNVRSD